MKRPSKKRRYELRVFMGRGPNILRAFAVNWPKKYFRFRVTRRAAASSLGVEVSKCAAFWHGPLDGQRKPAPCFSLFTRWSICGMPQRAVRTNSS